MNRTQRHFWQMCNIARLIMRPQLKRRSQFDIPTFMEALESRVLLTSISGHITQNTVLSDTATPYVLTNDLYVDAGATLTLAPGVTLKSANSAFDIFVNGTIKGTNAIIQLVGTPSSRGDKSHLLVHSNGTLDLTGGRIEGDSFVFNFGSLALSGVAITPSGGGSDPTKAPYVLASDGAATIDHASGSWKIEMSDGSLALTNSELASLKIRSGLPTVTGNTFTDSHPISLVDLDAGFTAIHGNTFSAPDASIALTLLSGISTPVTLSPVDGLGAYTLATDTLILPQGSLTLSPGVRLIKEYSRLVVAGQLITNQATLDFFGSGPNTLDKGITVLDGGSLSMTGGAVWGPGSIILAGHATIDHVTFLANPDGSGPIQSLGKYVPIVTALDSADGSITNGKGEVTIALDSTHFTVTGNRIYTLLSPPPEAIPNITGNTFTFSAPVFARLEPESFASVTQFEPLFDANTFMAGATLTIPVSVSGVPEGDRYWGLPNATVVYLLNTPNTTIGPAGDTLTFDPGVVLKYDRNAYEQAPLHMNVNGTADRPVIFTSIYDDTAGGDSLFDGDTTAPSPGDWVGLKLKTGAVAYLNHLEVRYATTGIYANYTGAALHLDGGIVRDNSQYGVYIYTPNVVVDINNSIISDNGLTGIFLRADTPGHVIRNCSIIGNGLLGTGRDSAGIHVGASTTLIENSIIAFNKNGLYHGDGADTSLITVNHTLFFNPAGSDVVWNGDPGRPDLSASGNLTADPLFIDRANGNLDLGSVSPAIDAGEGDSATPLDARGRARFDDPGVANTGAGAVRYVDLGALERQTASLPIDLELSGLVVAAGGTSAPGGAITVSWTGRNNSETPIVAGWTDSIYLSPDQFISSAALPVAQVHRAGPLNEGATYAGSWTGTIPASAAGPLNVLVLGNSGRAFSESALNNNLLTADVPLTVVPTVLAADAVVTANSRPGGWTYFAYHTAAGIAVDFKLVAPDPRLHLYVRRGAAPLLSAFDSKGVASGSDQVVRVPDPLQGLYYIGIYADAGAPARSFRVVASTPALSIVSVAPGRLGAHGASTLRIEGNGFEAGAQVELVSGGVRVAAQAVSYDAGGLSATFDPAAQNLAPGPYQVAVSNPISGQSVVSSDTVTIEAQSHTGFHATLAVAGLVRPGRVISVQVVYQNDGNVDLLSPLLQIDGNAEDLAWSLEGSSTFTPGTHFQFMALSPQGDPTVLRPGQRVSVTMRVLLPFREDEYEFVLKSLGVDNSDGSNSDIDWPSIENDLRPEDISDADWATLLAGIKTQLGNKWGDYVTALRDRAARWGALGRSVYAVRDLMALVETDALGEGGRLVGGQVVGSADGSPVAGAMVRLRSAAGGVIETKSGADGRFILKGVNPDYVLWSVDGFQLTSPPAIDLQTIGDLSGARLTVTPLGAVSGSVRDTVSGGALVGAVVNALVGDEVVASAIVNAQGEFLMTNLAQGSYDLIASVNGRPESQPVHVSVTAARTTRDITLSIPHGGQIHGTVETASGHQPIIGAIVSATNNSGDLLLTTTDENGSFTLTNVVVGTWSIAAKPSDTSLTAPGAGWLATTPTVIEVSENANTQTTIIVNAATEITGVVTDDSGAPVAGITVIFSDGQSTAAAVTDVQGTYRLTGLIPTDLDNENGGGAVAVDDPHFLPRIVQDIRTLEGQVTGVNIQLSRGIEVHGLIHRSDSDAAVVGARLLARAETDFYNTEATDSAGAFTLRVEPGTYTLQVNATGYSAFSQQVNLVAGSPDLNLVLTLTPQASAALSQAVLRSAAAVAVAAGFDTGALPPIAPPECPDAMFGGKSLGEFHQQLNAQRLAIMDRLSDLKTAKKQRDGLLEEWEDLTEKADEDTQKLIKDLIDFLGGEALKDMKAAYEAAGDFIRADQLERLNDALKAGSFFDKLSAGQIVDAGLTILGSIASLFKNKTYGYAAFAAKFLYHVYEAGDSALNADNKHIDAIFASKRIANQERQITKALEQYDQDVSDYSAQAIQDCCELSRSSDSPADVDIILGYATDPCDREPDAPGREQDRKPTEAASSKTPEDLFGPAGYSTPGIPDELAQRFVPQDEPMGYRIEFWNKTDAVVPTQDAVIENTLAPGIDLSTLEFTRIGFLKWDVPLTGETGASAVIQTRIDMRPDYNLAVEITGGIDPATRKIRWWFHAVDPITGQSPEDATAGFLPPFNPATGYEIGWVEYMVTPMASTPSGTVIPNQAFVEFDFAGDIASHPAPKLGPWTNTIDSGVPSSSVAPLAPRQLRPKFDVSWTGADDAGGSGIAGYDVVYSEDGGPWIAWLVNTTETTARFSGVPGHAYAFASSAIDHVGHRELLPEVGDAVTQVVPLVDMPISENQKVTYVDEDGDQVTISLKNAGNGVVRLPADVAQADAAAIELSGTTAASKLDISVKRLGNGTGRTTLGDVTITGSLAALGASAVDLNGDVSVTGILKSLTLGSLSGGTINVGGPLTPKDVLTMKLGRVTNSSINSATPIKSVTVVDWLDNDAMADEIHAPWIGTLSATGNRKIAAVRGDFEADVTLDDANAATSLAKVTIAGALANATISTAGNIGTIKAGSIFDSSIYAGLDDDTTGLPTIRAPFTTLAAGIASLTVTGVKGANPPPSFARSYIAAGTIGKVSLMMVDFNNDTTDFGFAATRIDAFSRTGLTPLLKKLVTPGEFDRQAKFLLRVV